jgi:hAT family C-terminal dimerisation region
MIARDIFTMPLSTIHFQSCFSSANKILIDKHSRLDVKTFERLVCLKYWFDAEQYNQHSPMEESSSGEFMTDADVNSDDIPKINLWYMNPNF